MDLCYVKDRRGAGELKANEGDEVEAGQNVEATLVVADEASEAGLPSEGALKHPATMPLRR
jgi:hypothetical protein